MASFCCVQCGMHTDMQLPEGVVTYVACPFEQTRATQMVLALPRKAVQGALQHALCEGAHCFKLCALAAVVSLCSDPAIAIMSIASTSVFQQHTVAPHLFCCMHRSMSMHADKAVYGRMQPAWHCTLACTADALSAHHAALELLEARAAGDGMEVRQGQDLLVF